MINVQALIDLVDDVSWVHRIVDNFKQKMLDGACILTCAEVTLDRVILAQRDKQHDLLPLSIKKTLDGMRYRRR